MVNTYWLLKYFLFYFKGYFYFRIILGQYEYYTTFKTITGNEKSQYTETKNARKSIAYIFYYNRVYHEKDILLDINKTSKNPVHCHVVIVRICSITF